MSAPSFYVQDRGRHELKCSPPTVRDGPRGNGCDRFAGTAEMKAYAPLLCLIIWTAPCFAETKQSAPLSIQPEAKQSAPLSIQPGTTMLTLNKMCQENPNSRSYAVCMAYLRGLFDGMQQAKIVEDLKEYVLPAAKSRLGANSVDHRAMGTRQSQKRGRVRGMGRAACPFSGISLSVEPSKRWNGRREVNLRHPDRKRREDLLSARFRPIRPAGAARHRKAPQIQD